MLSSTISWNFFSICSISHTNQHTNYRNFNSLCWSFKTLEDHLSPVGWMTGPRKRVSPGLISPGATFGQGVPHQPLQPVGGDIQQPASPAPIGPGLLWQCAPPWEYPQACKPSLAGSMPGETLSPALQTSWVSLAFVLSGHLKASSRNEPQNTNCSMLESPHWNRWSDIYT